MENKKIFSEVYSELKIIAIKELIQEYSNKKEENILIKLIQLKQTIEDKTAENRSINAPNLSQNPLCKVTP